MISPHHDGMREAKISHPSSSFPEKTIPEVSWRLEPELSQITEKSRFIVPEKLHELEIGR